MNQTVAQLRTLAKSIGLRGYSKLRKPALLEAIARHKPVAKQPTVAALKAECRTRGLKGFSRLPKAKLLALLESTQRLAKPVVTVEQQILQAIASLPVELNDAKCLARYLANRATPSDTAKLLDRERRAIASLRDSAATDAEWRKWAGRYAAIVAGVN